MLIRNDDVAADTSLREIQTFCEICDRYGVTPIHAITPIGNVRPVHVSMDNATIRRVSGTALFGENAAVVEYLKSRLDRDWFALHGLWHTHVPSIGELGAALALLYEVGIAGWKIERGDNALKYFVPPFNEGEYGESVCVPEDAYSDSQSELYTLGSGLPRIEDYLEAGDPQAEIMYTHSWRFEHGPFTWPQLDKCLARLTGRS